MKLYEIRKEIMDCLYIPEQDEYVNEETGEVLNAEQFKALHIEQEEKRESIALLIKNYKAEREAVKTEKIRLEKRQKSLNNTIERLQNYLQEDLAGEKFKTAKVNIYYTTSKSVDAEIAEIEKMHDADQYLRRTVELNKDALKEAMKLGLDIPTAHYIEKTSMVIR